MKLALYIVAIVLMIRTEASCQETVFSLLKNDLELADQYFEGKNYSKALSLYLNVERKKSSKSVNLKIARSYHFLKNYREALSNYEKHLQDLPVTDLYYYAEAQAGMSDYDKAVESYQHYLSKVPNDPFIIKKIWRLNNIQFLFEDSAHYSVRPIQLNSAYGDLCAVPYQDGIVFLSNRKEIRPVEKLDASRQSPFYKLYYSKISQDTATQDLLHYESPLIFNKGNHAAFHAGPLSFFDGQRKMVFTSTVNKAKDKGGRTLQIYFAENIKGSWKITETFPFNSPHHSISAPTISEDGNLLYFSSDMKGGFGGKDIYRSERINNQWTPPVNVGDVVNTPYDEVFPFLHKNTLYFSSNGHAGFGGLDIFKLELKGVDYDEPLNMGYPLNTSFDDFGIVIDSLDTHGYFSSNRNHGGYNDDIYEFDMDLQTYPLAINGLLKFKEHNWGDSSDLKILAHAKIDLIDIVRNVTVHEVSCDSLGNFSLTIPYFSKYKLRVVGEDNDENIVSLEIPKHKKSHYQHEIVIVKDAFKSN